MLIHLKRIIPLEFSPTNRLLSDYSQLSYKILLHPPKPHRNPHKTSTQSLSSHSILTWQVLQSCLKCPCFAQCPPHCLPKHHHSTTQQCPQFPWLTVSSQLDREAVWYRRNGPPALWESVRYWSLLCHNDALKNERWVLGLAQLEIKGFDWSY